MNKEGSYMPFASIFTFHKTKSKGKNVQS